MKRKIFALCLLFAFTVAGRVQAQQVDKNAELGELIRMMSAAQDIPFLTLQFNTTIRDSAGIAPEVDSIGGMYRMSEGRYWAMVDSVEYVQGFNYNLAVYHTDQLIAVGKPSVNLPAFQLSLLDSIFQQVHVKSVSITQVDASTKLFRMEFNEESPYSGYEMHYNPFTYQVSSIVYYMKNAYEREDGTVGTAKISTVFLSYSMEEFSRDYFMEEKFIYKDTKGFSTRPAYSAYQIIITSDDL